MLDLSRRRVSANVKLSNSLPAQVAGDYRLCIFASTASGSTSLLSAHVPGDALCQGEPCWHITARQHVYRNPATSEGIEHLSLRHGRTASYRVRGRGANLSLPASLPAGSIAVNVQLRRTGAGGACYRADFPAVVPRSPSKLRARS
jgi:hypothetical protein